MTDIATFTPLHSSYPARLRSLEKRPESIDVRGGSLHASRAIAIVGSRNAAPEAARFARDLAGALARAGVVVVSGGAQGIDAAAHEGALAAGGRTWAVAGTGHHHCFPSAHAGLFATIGNGPGAMIWPFAPDYHHPTAFLARNRVLVALSDAVVVVQAGPISGAVHAAGWARKLGKPLWVVPAAPWMKAFAGSTALLDEGAHPLLSPAALLGSLGLNAPIDGTPAGIPDPALQQMNVSTISSNESDVLRAMSSTPLHIDAIASQSGWGAQVTSAALLTLALEDVVVEGPPGFFRRRDPRKH